MDFEIVKKGHDIKDKIEIIVDISYEDAAGEILKNIDAAEYSKEFKKRITDKLKEFKQLKKNECYKKFSFETESGVQLIILLLKKSVKAFDIQVALRKSVLSAVKDSKGNVLLNLEGISK